MLTGLSLNMYNQQIQPTAKQPAEDRGQSMDILDEMTKEEILGWIRGQAFFIYHSPRRSDLLFHRWQKRSTAQNFKRTAHLEAGKNLNMKQRDKYARQFNTSTDAKERLELLKKMAPYEKKMKKHSDEYTAIQKADDKIDKLYEQIDIERKKENL